MYNENRKKIAVIPKGTHVELEEYSPDSEYARLKNSPVNYHGTDAHYIKLQGTISNSPDAQLDQNKLDRLIVLPADGKIPVMAGDIIGYPGKPFGLDDHQVHIEAFTLDNLMDAESILNDPNCEDVLAQRIVLTIPAGTEIEKNKQIGMKLCKGDRVRVVETAANHVKIDVESMTRNVPRLMMDYGGKNKLNPVSGESTYFYTLARQINPNATNNADDHDSEKFAFKSVDEVIAGFNGLIEPGTQILHYHATNKPNRMVSVVLAGKADGIFWVSKESLPDAAVDQTIVLESDIGDLFKDNPESNNTAETTSAPIQIDQENDTIPDGDKLWMPVKDSDGNIEYFVNIQGLERESPFRWPGFEFLLEEPANGDAFADIGAFVSKRFSEDKQLQNTQSAAKLREAIADQTKKHFPYAVEKAYASAEWLEAISKLIIRCPSEWSADMDKWSRLDEIAGAMAEPIRTVIKESAWWQKVAETHFTAAGDEAKAGKAVFFFHPLYLSYHLAMLLVYGIKEERFEEFKTLVHATYTLCGNNVSEQNCQALAGLICNRIGREDWAGCKSIDAVASSMISEYKHMDTESFLEISEWIKPIFLARKYAPLPDAYVMFHPAAQSLQQQPWDVDDIEQQKPAPKTLGDFTFYAYKTGHFGFATQLGIRRIKLLPGSGFKGSEWCRPQSSLCVKDGNKLKSVRIKADAGATLTFEYEFNIEQGFEFEKQHLSWQISYEYEETSGEKKTKKKKYSSDGTKFSCTLPKDISGYSLRIEPLDHEGEVLHAGFDLFLLQDDYMVFNGTDLLWINSRGEKLKFGKTDSFKAVSGAPDKRTGAHQNKEEGTIPQGTWKVARNDLETYNMFNLYHFNWFAEQATWGKCRIKLTPDKDTNTSRKDEEFYICGGEADSSEGNIVLGEAMDAFQDVFSELVPVYGDVELRVQYRPFYDISRYQKADTWKDLKKGDGGDHVKNLQRDLLGLGYWISSGLSLPIGIDGDFGDGLYSGVKTFQYEQKDVHRLKVNGIVDKGTAQALINILNDEKNYVGDELKFERPGIEVDLSGVPESKFCVYAKEKPSRPTRFYQLPPSKEGYWLRYGGTRYTKQTGVLSDCLHNDIWGAKETIRALMKIGAEWTKKYPSDPVEIGDIATWKGGYMSPHGSHQDGFGVDIRTETAGAMVRQNSPNKNYSKDLSLKFAKIIIKHGFRYVMTMCPHVTKEININAGDYKLLVNQVNKHHHHLHIDYWVKGSIIRNEHIERSYCSSCIAAAACDSDHKQG